MSELIIGVSGVRGIIGEGLDSRAAERLAQAYAAMHGRDYIIPDDVKYMAVACLAHRMVMNPENILGGETTTDLVQEMLQRIEVPMTAV